MTLDECRAAVGKTVVYAAAFYGTAGAVANERGVITGIGPQYVFVRYAGDKHSKATHPSKLELA